MVSIADFSRIKIRYHIYGTLLVMLAVVLSALPTYFLTSLIAELMGVDMSAPSQPSSGLDSFDYLVLLIMLFNFLASVALIIGVICKHKKWTYKNGVYCLLLGKNMPKYWLD